MAESAVAIDVAHEQLAARTHCIHPPAVAGLEPVLVAAERPLGGQVPVGLAAQLVPALGQLGRGRLGAHVDVVARDGAVAAPAAERQSERVLGREELGEAGRGAQPWRSSAVPSYSLRTRTLPGGAAAVHSSQSTHSSRLSSTTSTLRSRLA